MAGNFGVTIARPLAVGGVGAAGYAFSRDLIAGLPAVQEILAGACLAWAFLPASTTVPAGLLAAHLIEA